MAALDLCGGDPAVDFVNTLGGAREGPWDDEWLNGYADLVVWATRAGLLARGEELAAPAAEDPRAAAAVHAEAIALREALYAVLAAIARGDGPPAGALAAVRDAHRAALAHARLEVAGERLDWGWEAGSDLRRPLWPVAQAAVDLLRSDRIARLKQCRNCRWLFLDSSRNRSRRWCSMAHCGIEAKVAATRERRRAARR